MTDPYAVPAETNDRETILLVDDEEPVRRTFQEWLAGLNCRILTAADAEAAARADADPLSEREHEVLREADRQLRLGALVDAQLRDRLGEQGLRNIGR